MKDLQAERRLPADRIFLREPDAPRSSTIEAMRRGYRSLRDDAANCPHGADLRPATDDIYYIV